MAGIDISNSHVSPGSPKVDTLEEIIRVKRKLALEHAKFERELAELRTGLVSVREIKTKQAILWGAGIIVFVALLYLIYHLFSIEQYTYGAVITFFLIIYVIAFLALHDAGIRKIVLSTKDIKLEK